VTPLWTNDFNLAAAAKPSATFPPGKRTLYLTLLNTRTRAQTAIGNNRDRLGRVNSSNKLGGYSTPAPASRYYNFRQQMIEGRVVAGYWEIVGSD